MNYVFLIAVITFIIYKLYFVLLYYDQKSSILRLKKWSKKRKKKRRKKKIKGVSSQWTLHMWYGMHVFPP